MIKGLVPRLSEVGKIKIGGLGEERKSKKGDVYRLPVKMDHFVITKTNRDGNGDLEIDTELMDVLSPSDPDTGEYRDLHEIPIVLHSDEVDEVFPTAYAMYNGKKLYCSGDGENAERRQIKDGQYTGARKRIACPCEFLEDKQCKPHGTLHCSIRVPGSAVAGAVYRWRTTSIISIQQMLGSMIQIKTTCGVLQGLPLVLVLKPMAVAPVGAPASTVYVCHIELRAKDINEVQQQALELARMRNTVRAELGQAHAQYRAMLQAPASDDEPFEEQALVGQEFHPPQPEGQAAAVAGLLDAARAAAKPEPPMAEAKTKPEKPVTEQPSKTKQTPLQRIMAVAGTKGLAAIDEAMLCAGCKDIQLDDKADPAKLELICEKLGV